MRGLSLSILALCVLAGCETFSFRDYLLSQRNLEALRDAIASGGVSSLAVGEFTAAKPNQSEISCGINGQIRTPQQIPFEKYIRAAIIDELKKADAYSLDQIEAGRVITGRLDDITLNSDNGSWDIRLTIRFKSGESFTVSESYLFDDISCEKSTAAFIPAVQDLIYKVLTHPAFRQKMDRSAT